MELRARHGCVLDGRNKGVETLNRNCAQKLHVELPLNHMQRQSPFYVLNLAIDSEHKTKYCQSLRFTKTGGDWVDTIPEGLSGLVFGGSHPSPGFVSSGQPPLEISWL